MKLKTKIILTALACLASLAITPSAFAEPKAKPAADKTKQTAESHYNKGMTAYTLGHFQEAIDEFEKAYFIRSEPIFLYNIAQSHRQDNNLQRAIFFYRRYLEADPSTKKRAEVEKRMTELQGLLDAQKEREAVTQPQPQPVVAQPVPVVQPEPVVAQPLAVVNQPAPVDAHEGRGLRIGGIVVGSLGLALGVTGVVLALQGQSMQDDATTKQWDQTKYDNGKTLRTVGWIGCGVGAAALATGVVLYIVGAKSSDGGPSVALAPLLTPGAGGATLVGRF